MGMFVNLLLILPTLFTSDSEIVGSLDNLVVSEPSTIKSPDTDLNTVESPSIDLNTTLSSNSNSFDSNPKKGSNTVNSTAADLISLESKKEEFLDIIKKSSKKTFVLDYDGKLTPKVRSTAPPIPTDRIKTILKNLSDKNIRVIISTGRSKSNTQEWFSEPHFELIAEQWLSS